jgi:hypothetical protein
MVLDMKEPAEFARQVEEHPQLPPAGCERVAGYGVMGLPFRSGHVLGLRRWTASSVGEGFTSIWHRNPSGQWTFYESVRSQSTGKAIVASTSTRSKSRAVDWHLELGATLVTRLMSIAGSALPLAAWRSRPVLSAMGRVAGWLLGVGTVKLTGMTSNRQPFDANPQRIWLVTPSHAVVEGQELGAIGPLAEQAHLGDFYMPQRGIFAIGRVFITRVPNELSVSVPTMEAL